MCNNSPNLGKKETEHKRQQVSSHAQFNAKSLAYRGNCWAWLGLSLQSSYTRCKLITSAAAWAPSSFVWEAERFSLTTLDACAGWEGGRERLAAPLAVSSGLCVSHGSCVLCRVCVSLARRYAQSSVSPPAWEEEAEEDAGSEAAAAACGNVGAPLLAALGCLGAVAG